MTERHEAPAPAEAQVDRLLQSMADSFAQQLRSPILHSPAEHRLDYQDVTFPALDGVPLEGWFIPAAGSDRLVIANHPMGFSRAGIPTHLEPWRSIWASSGNDFEVNLVPSSTFAAMTQFPEAFDGVRCLVGTQPVTMKTIIQRRLVMAGVPADRIDDLEQRLILGTSIGFARRAPQEWASNVRAPAFLYQVHDDVLTEPGDVQAMFDNIPVADKKLQWIHGTTRRWDGYLEFQRHPEPMLAWFAQHMS